MSSLRVMLRRAVIAAARRTGTLDRARSLRRLLRSRRDDLVAGARRRSYERRIGDPGTRVSVRHGTRWTAAQVVERFVAHDEMAANLGIVARALADAGIDHFWCPVSGDQQYRIGVDDTSRPEVWRTLVGGNHDGATYLWPSGMPARAVLPLDVAPRDVLWRWAKAATVWTVYRAITDPARSVVVGPEHGVQVEFWRREERPVDGAQPATRRNAVVPADEAVSGRGGTEVAAADLASVVASSPATLRCRRANPVTNIVAVTELDEDHVTIGSHVVPTTSLFARHHRATTEWFPIDVVYTWVDGNDPEWRARRDLAIGAEHPVHSADGRSAFRFTNRDELRYSMRSLHQFAEFVRHVYLVTDGQVPAWLDPQAPGITVVDHRDIFDPEHDVLPTFNSHAIEARLHRIDGLSEHYLYVNDDVFFGRRVSPELFFHRSGISKYFLSRAGIPSGAAHSLEPSVSSAAKNGRDLLFEHVHHLPVAKFKHTPHAQRRSVIYELERRFPEAMAAVGRSQFRGSNDISVAASLHHHYGYATGTSVPGSIIYQYVNLAADSLPDRLDLLTSGRYDTWCLNDADVDVDDLQRVDDLVGRWLERALPFPSRFERR